MKKILLLLIVLLSLRGHAQVIADPALSLMRFNSIFPDTGLDATALPIDIVIKLKVPVLNRNLNNALPSGTCKIKIGLGSKLILDPSFNLATVNTSNYFHWTSEFYGGQVQITGDLVAQLPANFSDTATFNVKGSILGNSTITNNFLVTNHNTTTILSDEDPTNNISFIAYTINQGGGPIPVNFTKLLVSKEGCSIKVNFDAEQEINVKKYDIEISKDGIHFNKAGQLAATGQIHYQYSFPITDNIKAAFIYVRIRSVDLDEKFQYTEIKKVIGNCAAGWTPTLYPNPLSHTAHEVTITAGEGIFNGSYTVSVFDIAGKLLNTKQVYLSNTTSFNYETGKLAAGEYIIKMFNTAADQSAVLKLQKL